MTLANSVLPRNHRIEVFYDGACPFCMREIRFLRRKDKKRQIQFTDIRAADFQARDYGKTKEAFLSEIHGRLPDGTWVRGVEVFRILYSIIGFGFVASVTRLPILAGLLDWAYRLFARNRLRWTQRCASTDGSCETKARSTKKNSCPRAATDHKNDLR